jgi:hypothetical protein
MKRLHAKKREQLIADYQKTANTAFFVLAAFVLLVALPTYDGHDFFPSAMRAFSEWMASWFPQLDAIASTRENPTKTKIVLSFVLAMMPVEAGYFLSTMPKNLAQENLPLGQLVRRLWIATLVAIIAMISFVAMMYVLAAPGWENPGDIARRFMPFVNTDIGSGLLLLLTSSGTVQGISFVLVFISYILFDLLNRKEKQ